MGAEIHRYWLKQGSRQSGKIYLITYYLLLLENATIAIVKQDKYF